MAPFARLANLTGIIRWIRENLDTIKQVIDLFNQLFGPEFIEGIVKTQENAYDTNTGVPVSRLFLADFTDLQASRCPPTKAEAFAVARQEVADWLQEYANAEEGKTGASVAAQQHANAMVTTERRERLLKIVQFMLWAWGQFGKLPIPGATSLQAAGIVLNIPPEDFIPAKEVKGEEPGYDPSAPTGMADSKGIK